MKIQDSFNYEYVDRPAANTLIKNRPNWNVLCEDVGLVATRDLEKELGVKK